MRECAAQPPPDLIVGSMVGPMAFRLSVSEVSSYSLSTQTGLVQAISVGNGLGSVSA